MGAPKEKKEGAEKKEVKKKPYVPTIEDEMKRTEAIIKFGEDSAEFAAKKAEKTYKKSPAYKMMKAFNNGWNTEPEWKREREAAVLLQEEEEVSPATAAEAPKEKKEGAEKKEAKKKPYVPTIEDEMKRPEAI